MSDDRGSGGVLVAFVLGAIAGAAVALLRSAVSSEWTARLFREFVGAALEQSGSRAGETAAASRASSQ